jgi:hypothetical protein
LLRKYNNIKVDFTKSGTKAAMFSLKHGESSSVTSVSRLMMMLWMIQRLMSLAWRLVVGAILHSFPIVISWCG